MVLHALLDLPAELLLEIIAILHAQPISKNECRIRLLWPLSETCKQLNGCCGLWIFARYHLCLRTSSDKRFTLLTPLRISESLRHWNLDAVKARLLHFREKASCVRELILEDIKDREEEPEIFPDCILFDLIDVLKYAHKLTSIEVTCRQGGTLPLALWDWMRTKNLTALSVGTNLAPPPGAQMHPMVHKFKGYLSKETILFLDVSDRSAVIVKSTS
jgi:hypothetical protein